jgi:hypothetical protein
MVPRLALTCAFVALVCPATVFGQPPRPPQQLETDGVAPAHVALVDGAASLEREGRAENSPLNMPLLSGDRLRTADGRVEVLFADGSTLHLDMRSTIDVQSDDLVRLTEGRLRLNILGPARTVAYRIDSPAGSARITQPGEYRIALLRGTAEIQLELAVVRGAAEVFTDQGSTPVRAGERAYASAGLAPSYAYAFNSATWDAFDRWSEARRDVRLGVSSQYLPSDMQAYAPLLDESGDWRYTESYGYAWYPRVGVDWRPYYYGRWDSYPRYGWTWIGADPFAWPTHHYGRWGFSAGVWFWIPSSRWAPAYVSWAYAPGYVSWCPLGFDNRPIISINFYRNGAGYYSPWRAWTAVSSAHFGGRGFYVNQRAVNWDRAGGQRPRFENRPSAPRGSRDITVPRNSTPIRWAGSNNVVPPGDNRALSRGNGAPSRDNPRIPASPTRAESGAGVGRPPAPGGVEGRPSATPRYVNRGDEIVRSRTERPTPPSPTAREGQAVPRSSGGAEMPPSRTDRRTAPEGPARPSRPEVGPIGGAQERPVDPSTRSGSPRAESRGDGAQGRPYQPRGYEPRPTPGRAEPIDGTQGRPSVDRPMAQPRTNEPRGGQNPSYQPQPPAHEVPPRNYERARPGNEARPTPPRQPERAAPAERAPTGREGRQPPPERAAPAEKAAPRAGTAPPPSRRGGRGGV